MTSEKNGNDDRGPIEVDIEPKARRRFRLMWGAYIALVATYPYLVIDGPFKLHPIETPLVVGVFFFSVIYSMPVWIGRWPAWVVRLLGRRHLLKMLSDTRTVLSNRQAVPARLNEPRTWLYDYRVATAVLVACMFALGLWSALLS